MVSKIIQIDNVSEYAAIVSLLFNCKYKHFNNESFETLVKDWGHGVMTEYTWVCLDERNRSFCGYAKVNKVDRFSFSDGLKYLTKDFNNGKIDIGDYKNCFYNKKQVKVGCQTIPFETIEKLYQRMKAL